MRHPSCTTRDVNGHESIVDASNDVDRKADIEEYDVLRVDLVGTNYGSNAKLSIDGTISNSAHMGHVNLDVIPVFFGHSASKADRA